MLTYRTPGVYREDVFEVPAAALRTAVPAFLGFAETGAVNEPRMLTLWPEFEEYFGLALPEGYLAHAVRGFFENGGELCYVVRLRSDLESDAALAEALEQVGPLDTIDLVCVPDVACDPVPLQQAVLDHCEAAGERFAILDALPGATVDGTLDHKRRLSGTNGALYYPWIRVVHGPAATDGFIPPCGHVAGVYARTDRRAGVHKAPANERLEGVLDLQVNLTNDQQGRLNPQGINCLRAFPGRGIRVWGARTLSDDPNWTYVSVRRLFLTAGRWIERNLAGTVFEPNDSRVWTRITRELTAYFTDLLNRGALKGNTPQEAFRVKCDAETNPRDVREAGMVITDIALAPAVPGEFIVVRIFHGARGVTITTPLAPYPGVTDGAKSPTGPSPAEVRIIHIEYDPSDGPAEGEYVDIENSGGTPIELTGWRLKDLADHEFTFPDFSLGAGASVRVWTGTGTDTAADLYCGRGWAIWNNVGDKAMLFDAAGSLVDEYVCPPIDD